MAAGGEYGTAEVLATGARLGASARNVLCKAFVVASGVVAHLPARIDQRWRWRELEKLKSELSLSSSRQPAAEHYQDAVALSTL